MKKRITKKKIRTFDGAIELIEMVMSLQYELDEANRFLGDLLILLVDREHKCLESSHDLAGPIWNEVIKLLKENRELRGQVAQNLQEDKPKIAN